jgi:hypothetical protein
VPLSFAPGEAYQFDWSHEVVLLSGTTVMVKVAHVRLCHSRMMFVRAYPRETQEMVFDAHDRAFALFKGACSRGIYDNMKTAVETIFVGKDRRYNRRFLQMCSHYVVDRRACLAAGTALGVVAGDQSRRCAEPWRTSGLRWAWGRHRFSGTYDGEGAECEATALAGKRSIRFRRCFGSW